MVIYTSINLCKAFAGKLIENAELGADIYNLQMPAPKMNPFCV